MERYECTEESRFACPNMCSEEIGFIEEMTAGFYTGHEILALPHAMTQDPEVTCQELLTAVATHKSTLVYADQFYTSFIINHPELREGHDISSVECWILGGSGMSANFKQTILDKWPKSVVSRG